VSDVESADRPPMDLFKAIFENSEPSSSSSSSDEDEDEQKMDVNTADSLQTAADKRPDSASDIAAAAVPISTAVSSHHLTQPKEHGMLKIFL